ncbi:lysylphosphatidylglycerol synthase transmembrane domain-containing protein [Oceanibacterium hippocampi]|uniref:Flippase-like domain-containing protein n=1 Tax=Oceanibacterium hippocampi TaxID=745714 RepID=A0A1Y5TH08_9PROT|nr:lysylphosphatidylglycerol synthase transmembrane domain-containing protein [Oceanibacterium hippocampi]SLN61852.1 hypothetical protein OCH7691_02726 [Oceanibacterium hippocampi]
MSRLLAIPGLKIAVGLGLLALILTQIPLDELGRSLIGLDPLPLVAGIVVVFAMRLFAAARLRLILRRFDFHASVASIFAINLRTAYFSFFLPGHLAGGAAKWYLLKRRGTGGANALVGIVYDRLNEVSSLVAIGFAASLMIGDIPGGDAIRLTFAALFAAIVIAQMAILNERFLVLSRALAERIGLVRLPLFARIFDKLADSSRAFHDLPIGWRAWIWSYALLGHTVGIGSYALFSHAVGLDLAIVDLAWVRSAVAIVGLLPLTFAGLGVREGTLIVLLGAYGIGAVEAVAFSLTLFLRLVVVSAAGGLLLVCDLARERNSAVPDRSE